jgi:hypothetical protein
MIDRGGTTTRVNGRAIVGAPKIVEDCIEIVAEENKDDKPKHEDLCPKNLNNGDCNEEPVIVTMYDDNVDPTRQISENEYEECEVENKEHKVKYDDEHLSNEDWFQMLQEKKLIDELLSGRVIQFEDQFNEQDVTEYKDYDADMNEELFIKHNDIGLTALAEENREEEEENSVVVFTYNQDLEFVDDIMDEEETEKVNKKIMHWSPEEIKHYYGFMCQQSIEQDIEETELVEKGVEMNWHHPSCSKKRYPEFMIWSKKKKKQVKSIKVWSNKFRKKFHQYIVTKKVKMKYFVNLAET